jgi:hypothetical protein
MDVEKLSLTIFEGAKGVGLVDRFLANYMACVETSNRRGRDESAVDRRRNGAAHMLRQAKSIFAEDKLPLYVGLNLPDVEAFRQRARIDVRVREHVAIAPGVMERMAKAAEKLKGRQWLVHVALKHLGLRPNELLEARMGWLVQSEWGQWFFAVVVTSSYRPKASLGYTPICREVAEALVRKRMELARETGETVGNESPLIPGINQDDRWGSIYREHSTWMRQWVPAETFDGSNYELRRWATQKIRAKYGKDAASDFARHSARDVTQAHYLERRMVWRDRAPEGNAGISLADVRGVKGAKKEKACVGWESLAK